MNTKRQTIWLVSMLSLMVVLSAYYLFTEDVDKGSTMTTAPTNGELKVDEVSGANWNSVQEGLLSEDDEAVLRQIEQNLTSVGGDYITKLQFSRIENYAKEESRLLGIISDTKQDEAQMNAAIDELNRLEEQEERLASIEAELSASFPSVIIAEENNRFKVVVQSENLDRAQAADIVEMVMKTMEIGAGQVSVQYIP